MWDRLHMRHPGLAVWRVGMCEALVALGDRTTAWRFAEEHRALAEQVGSPGPRAAALRALATAAGGQQAVALLEQAVELVRGTPMRLEHVRALVALGAALRRVNRRTDAREVLRSALDLAEHGGMRLLARRARQELAAAGARPRRRRTSGARLADSRRAPRGDARRVGPQQPRDRPGAVRHPPDGRDAPDARVHQARHHRALPARGRAGRRRYRVAGGSAQRPGPTAR